MGVWWFGPTCPVAPREQMWIDDSMGWFESEFGVPRPIVLPEHFTGLVGAQEVFAKVAGCLGIDPGAVDLELYAERPLHHDRARGHSAAGHYRTRKGRPVIAIETGQALKSLVSTVAHELGHVLLLGDARISHTRRDHEPLTDLLTVHFGLGIFSANAAFEFTSHQSGWSWEKLGYLTEPMYGYALARYAWSLGEPKPGWAEHLDLNPRTCLRQGLRYFRNQAAAAALHPARKEKRT
jgi:hypothetical protein